MSAYSYGVYLTASRFHDASKVQWGCIGTTHYSECTSKHPDSVYLVTR